MADDIEKFVLSYSVDSSRATKMLQDLNELIEKTNKTGAKGKLTFAEFLRDTSPEFGKMHRFVDSAAKGMDSFARASLGAKIGLGGIATALTAIGIATKMAAEQMNIFNQRRIASGTLGMGQLSQEAFARNVFSASGGGITANAALGSAQRLSDLINEAVQDPNPASKLNMALQMAGINPRGANGMPISGAQGMNEMAKALQGMAPARAAGVVGALGISEDPQNFAKALQAIGGNTTKMSADLINSAASIDKASAAALDMQNKMNGLRESLRRTTQSIGDTALTLADRLANYKGFEESKNAPGWLKRLNRFGAQGQGGYIATHQPATPAKAVTEHAEKLQQKSDQIAQQQMDTTDQFKLAVNLFAGASSAFSDTLIDSKQAWAAWAGEVGAASGLKASPYIGSTGSSVNQLNQGVTRGMRNNNPGNLEAGAFATAHGATGTDGRFAVFPTMAAGNAAMLALLQSKAYAGGGINTISGIINKYAPSSENDTASYIKAITAATGIAPGAKLTPDQLKRVQIAMAVHESGATGGRNFMRIGANPKDEYAATYDPNYSPDMGFGPSVNVRGGGQTLASTRFAMFAARIGSQIGASGSNLMQRGFVSRGDVEFALRSEQAKDVKDLARATLALQNIPKNLPPTQLLAMHSNMEQNVRAASSNLADLMDYGSELLGRSRAGARELTRNKPISMTITAPITIQGGGMHGPELAAHIRREFETNLAPHLADIVNHANDDVSY
jgi:hypothetical protein